MKNHAQTPCAPTARAEFAEPVAAVLAEYRQGNAGEDACSGCAGAYCCRGGFAILENVLMIHERYRAGELQREDYQFVGGMPFPEFVETYFDKEIWRDGAGAELLLFHMKSLGPGGHTVAVPEGANYRETRDRLFDRNPWLNRGCIFLSQAIADEPRMDGRLAGDAATGRRCLLHEPRSATELGAKPAGCILDACCTPGGLTPAVDTQSRKRWLAALAAAYPGSVERFQELTQPAD